MEYKEYKWVVHGFYFNNENEYNLAKKDEERFMYIMNQIGLSSDKTIAVEIYNKLIESEKFKTVVGMSYLKELYSLIIRQGIATEDDLAPIEGFTVSRLHSASGYSYAQLNRIKDEMENNNKERMAKYKSTVHNLKIAICVLCVLVVTLFYFGINKNNASNYASAKENVIDEYTKWENELAKREQAVKEKEEKLRQMEIDIEKHN